MKKLGLIVIVVLMAGDCLGQVPNWALAKSMGGAGWDMAKNIAIDASDMLCHMEKAKHLLICSIL